MKYESLLGLIEPYADGPFDKLPDGLRQLVIEAFDYQSEAFDAHQWDELTPDQRRSLAKQHAALAVWSDAAFQQDQRRSLAKQHAERNDPADRYYFNLFNEIEKTKTAITDLELMNDRTPSEARIKREDLAAFGGRLDNLKKLETLPPFLVKDWKTLTNDVLAEVVAANAVQADIQTKAAPMPTESVSDGVEPANAGPLPLTTGDIAFCFAGLHWKTETKWKKPLGDKPKWLAACIVIPGVRGVSETRWSPVCIGAALVRAGHAKPNSVRAKFQTQPLLTPWLDEWKTYEADNSDSN